jgi:hypothetical protein
VSGFNSADECREVIGRVFQIMSQDRDMGPKLRDADAPQRWEFPDLELVVNVTGAVEGSRDNLRWKWSDDVEWEPEVLMTMDSVVANRYFQGKENMAMAVARRRIKTTGNLRKVLALVPVTKPVFAQYRAMLEREYPHLLD